jgi:hypothetical protein
VQRVFESALIEEVALPTDAAARLATFDHQLAAAAKTLGIQVLAE